MPIWIVRALLIQVVSTEGPNLKGRTRSDKVTMMADIIYRLGEHVPGEDSDSLSLLRRRPAP